MTYGLDDFDPERAVEQYREVLAQLDASTDAIAQDEYRRIAQRMREKWAKWNGSDLSELHETAMGRMARRRQPSRNGLWRAGVKPPRPFWDAPAS